MQTINSGVVVDNSVIELQLGSNEGVVKSAPSDLECATLGFFDMWLDGIKATKLLLDPLSSCFGAVLGTVCCVAVAAANAENNHDRPATRYDVVHANQIRRNEAAQAGCAFQMGYIAGDVAIDAASSITGALIGLPRAAFFSCTGNNAKTNTILGYSRQEIDEVDLFDSCAPVCCGALV
jgi:hypothetical protein